MAISSFFLLWLSNKLWSWDSFSSTQVVCNIFSKYLPHHPTGIIISISPFQLSFSEEEVLTRARIAQTFLEWKEGYKKVLNYKVFRGIWYHYHQRQQAEIVQQYKRKANL